VVARVGMAYKAFFAANTKLFPSAPEKTKGLARKNVLTLVILGRDGGIRTRDPLHPMQVRYQAALHPDVSLRV
jgi:hypothetical protein